MLPSPLQLTDAFMIHFEIKPRIEPNIFSLDRPVDAFQFKGTSISTQVEHSIATDEADENYTMILVQLTVELDDAGTNPPPYLCDVKCIGYFAISKKAFPDETKRIDVGVVNGASILYGIIREKVADFTSRAWYGTLTLPTGNFSDMAPSTRIEEEKQIDKKKDPVKKTRKTKSSV